MIDERNVGVRETHFSDDDAGNLLTRREQAREAEGSVEALETFDYRCWTLVAGNPVDERGAPR